jgi:hypothetical protein
VGGEGRGITKRGVNRRSEFTSFRLERERERERERDIKQIEARDGTRRKEGRTRGGRGDGRWCCDRERGREIERERETRKWVASRGSYPFNK